MPAAYQRALSLFAYVVGVLLVALACFYFFHVSETVAALIFMLCALIVGAYGSRTDAVIISFAAAICLDYFFIPPIFEVTIASVSGWVGLVVFLVASLMACALSSKLRQQRDELSERQSDSERLHALSRALLLSDHSEDMRRLLVNKCLELFGFQEAVLFESANGEFWRSTTAGSISVDDLRRVATYAIPETLANGAEIIPVILGNKTFGSLGYRGTRLSQLATNSLSNTIATGLAQAQAHEARSKADAVRRSEELKSVLIDALAHDLKTPLTAIEVASEVLVQFPEMERADQISLLQEVRQAAQGLHNLIHGAIHLARIDAKRLRLEARPTSVEDIIRSAMESIGDRASSHRILINVDPRTPNVLADGELLIQALKQLIDNALKYSPSDSTISISAELEDDLVTLSVRDQGPGLTEREQSRVFDKFYRGRYDGSAIQGTGMGLAIAKEIAEAHSGSVGVESQIGKGTRFTITLKAAIMGQFV